MSLECQFCKKNFTSKWNLNNHQKTAKHCLKIQKEKGIENKNTHIYFCNFCNKTFTTKQYLNKI